MLGGNFGLKKTLKKIKDLYYWFKIADDMKLWCQACRVCGRAKGSQTCNNQMGAIQKVRTQVGRGGGVTSIVTVCDREGGGY